MAYATPQDLLARYDARTVGDLCGDANTRISQPALATDPNLQAALEDASGEIDGALLQGERYSVNDLTGLTGNSKNLLTRICCDIAFGLLWNRRAWLRGGNEEPIAGPERGQHALERLRKGENVFNLGPTTDAGLPNNVGPSTIDLQNLNTITGQTRNYYPLRFLPNNR